MNVALKRATRATGACRLIVIPNLGLVNQDGEFSEKRRPYVQGAFFNCP